MCGPSRLYRAGHFLSFSFSALAARQVLHDSSPSKVLHSQSWSECWPFDVDRQTWIPLHDIPELCPNLAAKTQWSQTSSSSFARSASYVRWQPKSPQAAANENIALEFKDLQEGSLGTVDLDSGSPCAFHLAPRIPAKLPDTLPGIRLGKALSAQMQAFDTEVSKLLRAGIGPKLSQEADLQEALLAKLVQDARKVLFEGTPDALHAAGWKKNGHGFFLHNASKTAMAVHPANDVDKLATMLHAHHGAQVDASLKELETYLMDLHKEPTEEIPMIREEMKKLKAGIREAAKTEMESLLKEHGALAKPLERQSAICFSSHPLPSTESYGDARYCICPLPQEEQSKYQVVNIWLSKVQRSSWTSNAPILAGTAALESAISGPFTQNSISHGVFEIVVPLVSQTVALKSLRTKDPCTFYIYRKSNTGEYVTRAWALKKEAMRTEYAEYLEGSVQMKLMGLLQMAARGAQTKGGDSLLERSNSSVSAAQRTLSLVQSSYREALEEAVEASSRAEELLESAKYLAEQHAKGQSKLNSQATEESMWSDLKRDMQIYTCMKYIPSPQSAFAWMGKKSSKRKCALKTILRKSLEGLDTRSCSVECLGSCDAACPSELFPVSSSCPLDSGIFRKLSDLKEEITLTLKGSQACSAVMLEAGLWVPRPDTKLKQLKATVDLLNWNTSEMRRSVELVRDHDHQLTLHLHEMRAGRMFHDDSIRLRASPADVRMTFPKNHSDPRTAWALPKGTGIMDDLFLRLSRRIQMCKVKKVGVFNLHFEAVGSLVADAERMLGPKKSSGKVAALLMSEASITAYHGNGGFVGPDLGAAASIFGNPDVAANPSAWWREMEKRTKEDGWRPQGEMFGVDACLMCEPSPGTAGLPNKSGKCSIGLAETPYVYVDEDGLAPVPPFLSWTTEAKTALASKKDYRGLWQSADILDFLNLDFPVAYTHGPKLAALGLPTASVIGLHKYDKAQAGKDTAREFVSSGFTREKPGFDYSPDLLEHCFVVALAALPEETKGGWRKADYTRMRLCTNHWDSGPSTDGESSNRFSGLPEAVTTKREDILSDMQSFVTSVALVAPVTTDSPATGKLSGSTELPQCFPVSEADFAANTCVAGLELLGANLPCVENPENPCPEGTACTCDMGLDTMSGKAKFAAAFLTVQTLQGAFWMITAQVSLSVAVSTQLFAGPSDAMNAFLLLTLVEGKKTCGCGRLGFPMFTEKDEAFGTGCVYKPLNIQPAGSINQLNPYWFLPPPGMRIVPGRMNPLKGVAAGSFAGFMAASLVSGESIAQGTVATVAGLAGAAYSTQLASCRTEQCPVDDLTVGWRPKQGFSNCDVYAVHELSSAERVAYYDAKFAASEMVQEVNEHVATIFPDKSIQVHRAVELKLRHMLPGHFNMPKGWISDGKAEWAMTVSEYALKGNPASQLIIGLLTGALGILDATVSFVADLVKTIASSTLGRFTASSKLATASLIVKYYYGQCMALECLQGVHSPKDLMMGIKPSNEQLALCKQGHAYQEDDISSYAYERLRLRHLISNLGLEAQVDL